MCQARDQDNSASSTTTSSTPSSSTPSSTSKRRTAQIGDIVTIDFHLSPEHGYVPHPLFDTTGQITFILGWGNYLPGLHSLLQGMAQGESLDTTSGDTANNHLSIDAGWGKRRSDLIVTVEKNQLQSITDRTILKEGCHLHLEGDIQVLITNVTDTTITVDANPPLAGTSFQCHHLTLQTIASLPEESVLYGYQENDDNHDDDAGDVIEQQQQQSLSQQESLSQQSSDNIIINNNLQVATFGLGCFWGAQLAFCRIPGVVGTKTGYTQGTIATPTYEQVCEGTSRHVEAVSVVYDANIVSYDTLLSVAMERLEQQHPAMGVMTNKKKNSGNGGVNSKHQQQQQHNESSQEPPPLWNEHDMAWLFGAEEEEESVQYRHGFYFHTTAQEQVAQQFIANLNNLRYRIELRPATTFYEAEEYHQHYLLKGGQSARKGAKETIRCFG